MKKVWGVLVISLVMFYAISIFTFENGKDLFGFPSDGWYEKAKSVIIENEYKITLQKNPFSSNASLIYQSPNRTQNIRTYYDAKMVRIVPRKGDKILWQIGFKLKERKLNQFQIVENKAIYQNEELKVEYENRKEGLFQKIEIKKKMKRNEIDFLIEGNLKPIFSENRKMILFFSNDSLSVLKFSLEDSSENSVNVTLCPILNGFRIVYDSKNISYPLTIVGIISSFPWIGEMNQNFSMFGFSVAGAGDLNGDGFSDVVIGAPYFDNGQLDEGAVFVYYGSKSGLSTFPSWSDESNFANYNMGLKVSTAGDVNGDGFSDLIVSQNTNLNEGAVKLYYGSENGLPSSPNWVGTPNQINSWYGSSIACAGDINGDGYSDIIIGAERYDGDLYYDEGAAFVYYGSENGLSQNPDWLYTSGQYFSYFGCSVSGAGDVNGDGFSDVIIGAKYWDNPSYTDEGKVFVFYGSLSGLSNEPDWTQSVNQAYALYGSSVASACDVNGDGYSDVIVGAPYYTVNEYREGGAFVYYGSSTGLTTLNWLKTSNKAWELFGYSVSSALDVNGDDYSDVLIGAVNYSNGETNEGAVYLYSGSESGLSTIEEWFFESNQNNAELGTSVSSCGDVNGDGFYDIIIGAPKYSNGNSEEGVAFLFYGSASTLSNFPEFLKKGDQAGSQFGYSVANVGDINGDGFSDVVVGAPSYDNGQTDEGAAFLFLGSSVGLSQTPSWIGESDQSEAYYGFSVASAGDINNDGYIDVIIGAPGYDYKNIDDGLVFAYYGSSSNLSTTPNWIKNGEVSYSYFGLSLSTANDVNGDGYADIIVGAPYYQNGEIYEGAVYLFYGSPSGLSSNYNFKRESNNPYSLYGISVSSAQDINNDGFSDIIIGAEDFTNDHNKEGAVFVFYGSNSPLNQNPDFIVESHQPNSKFGCSVSTGNDLNGDGFSDIVIGAKKYSNGETNEGAVFVFYGSSEGLSENNFTFLESNLSNSKFGHSVSSAGDVNGDGYSDLIIGAPSYQNGQIDEGAIFLYLGASSGVSSSYQLAIESNFPNSYFGCSLSGSQDINGDGYPDIVIGAENYSDNLPFQGAIFVSFGNENRAKTINFLQLKPSDSSLVFPPLSTLSNNSLLFKYRGNSFFGRVLARTEMEIRSTKEQFDYSNFYEGEWQEINLGYNNFNELLNFLEKDYLYKWRVRVKYYPKYGVPIHSRWFFLPCNGLNEADFRSGSGIIQDSDGDGYNDEEDCMPNDGSVWSPPSEVLNFYILKTPSNNLIWSKPLHPGCLVPQYDVLRSNLPSDFSSALCIETNTTNEFATDNENPNSIFYYLIRVENPCGQNMGKSSSGVPRTGVNCP